MREHALTVKARSLLLRVAALDAELLETLAQIFAEEIYLEEGYQSVAEYCIRGLGMSEDSAMRRRKAADLLTRYPSVLKPLLEQNRLHLTAIAMLHPVITNANAERLLTEACGKRIYEIETMIVREQPKPLINPGVFTNFNQAGLPSLSPTASSQPSAMEDSRPCFAKPKEEPLPQAPRVKPLQVNAHHFQFMGDDATLAIYNQVRDLEPSAAANDLFSRAMSLLRDELMRKKRGVLKKTKAMPADSATLRRANAAAVHSEPAAVPSKAADSAPAASTAAKTSGQADTSPDTSKTITPTPRTAERDKPERPVPNPGKGEWVGSKRDKRYISASLRREVYARDNFCCEYTSKTGRKCGSTRWLHLHHVIAWAKGGRTEAANLKVFCSAHNWYAGERDFGKHRRQPGAAREGSTTVPHNAGAARKHAPAIADVY